MPNYPIRVGFCAPSRAVMDISTPALAKLYFTDRGADVVLHDTVFKNVKQFAGTDAERVDGLMSLACNKDIDLAASGMTITKARAEKVLFSSPYYESGLGVVVPANADINTLQDLNGKTVSAQMGTTVQFSFLANASTFAKCALL